MHSYYLQNLSPTACLQGIVRYCTWLLLLTALLTGCSSPTYTPTQQYPTDGAGEFTRSVDELLAAAETAPSPEREHLMLQAANQLWQTAQYPASVTLLTNIDSKQLNDEDFAVFALLYGRWAVDQQQYILAETLIDNLRLAQLLNDLDPGTAVALHQLRSEYYLNTGDYLAALYEHTALTVLLIEPEQQAQNNRKLWWLLRNLPEQELDLLAHSHNQQLTGWIELTRIANARNTDLEEQISLLDNWLQRWGDHPAAHNLPVEMQLMQLSLAQRPQRVTLLVPLSGKLAVAGEAVRDGFLAAYYHSLQNGKAVPQITIVDSNREDFLGLYDEVATNSDLIIGPLDKQQVALLDERSNLPVPTLSLNYAEIQTDLRTENLYQFGLRPEDEARQAAELAFNNHFEKALVIAPGSVWGQRVSQAFNDSWQELGGTVIGNAMFDAQSNDYSKVIQQSLGVTDSKRRQRNINNMVSDPIEFEPRRRQDLDVIYLAARPEQARQIKPLLAFHYAGHVPVYASSTIYSGSSDLEKDTDLNGVYFSAMPWLFTNDPLKAEIDTHLSPNPALNKLYAMGNDAWRLHARLPLLAGSDSSKIHGSTGILRINDSNQVTRQQLWAVFRRGQVQLLPTITY